MALHESTTITLVSATGEDGEEELTWGEFIDAHPEMRPDELAAIRSAIENGNAYQLYAGKGAPVVYIRKA